MRELCSRLVQLPPATNGMALGLCGAASVLLELGADERAALCVMIPATALWILFSLRMLAAPGQAREELAMPPACSAYGAWQMVFLFIAARVVAGMSLAAAGAMVFLGALLQALILAAFLRACWRTRTAPEPFWNPPTVNCAVTAIVGAQLRARGAAVPAWLISGSFACALALQLGLVPPQVWRVLADDTVSPSAAVAMMQAPCSLNALAWGVLRRARSREWGLAARPGGGDGGGGGALAHALVAMSTLVLWLNVYAFWRRRAAIAARGVRADWVALTFPSCSSAVAALQYSSARADPASPALPPPARAIARAYALGLAALVLAVVFAVAAVLGRQLVRAAARGASADETAAPLRDLDGATEEGIPSASAGFVSKQGVLIEGVSSASEEDCT